jgi:flagellar protein FliO/FliZ
VISHIAKILFIVFLLTVSSAFSQPVASFGDGLLFSEPATFSVQATATPLFLDTQPASMPAFPDADPMGTSLRILSSLFFLIIVAFGISWFIQKKTGLGGNVFGKVLGILPLDNRRMIYIVDIMGKVLVLGVTESNINLLSELTDKDTLDSLRLQYNTQPLPGMEKLFSFLSGRDKSSEEIPHEGVQPEENISHDTTHQARQQERLKKLQGMLLKRGDNNTPENNP